MKILSIIGIIYITIQAVVFLIYGIDKRKAMNNQYRIPEKTLLLICIIGPFGGLLGMHSWRHKTKKWYFSVTTLGLSVLHFIGIIFMLQFLSF